MDPISQHECFAECHSTEHLIGKERTQQISQTMLRDTVFTHPLTLQGTSENSYQQGLHTATWKSQKSPKRASLSWQEHKEWDQ